MGNVKVWLLLSVRQWPKCPFTSPRFQHGLSVTWRILQGMCCHRHVRAGPGIRPTSPEAWKICSLSLNGGEQSALSDWLEWCRPHHKVMLYLPKNVLSPWIIHQKMWTPFYFNQSERGWTNLQSRLKSGQPLSWGNKKNSDSTITFENWVYILVLVFLRSSS